ncbi:MAG TPA: hypothetical protein VK726_21270 [Acetobacteraceae bacterium]|jgi:hypothetical protein|nr:hypothetical protein [Acetobacteraceae bacterium]
MRDAKGIEAAADFLDDVGRHHHWWHVPGVWTRRDLDPIGGSEFLAIVERIVRTYEGTRVPLDPA